MVRKVLWWANVLLGLWIAVAPWALGYRTVEPAFYNGLIAGLAVAAIAFIGWLVEQGVFGPKHRPERARFGETGSLRAA